LKNPPKAPIINPMAEITDKQGKKAPRQRETNSKLNAYSVQHNRQQATGNRQQATIHIIKKPMSTIH
jgi:hypothetical protein